METIIIYTTISTIIGILIGYNIGKNKKINE